MNGFQINTNVKVKKGKMAYIRKLFRKKEIRMGAIGVGAIAIIVALVLMFLAFVPTSKVTVLVSCEKNINRNGQIEREIEYYENGKITESVTYDGEQEITRVVFEYDKEGNLLKEKNHYDGMYYDYIEYVYENGVLVEKKNVLIDSTPISRITYQYDTVKTDLIKVETEYQEETGDVPVTITEYVYNENSELIKKISTNVESKKITTVEYKIEKGKVVEETRTTPTKTTVTTYIYDSAGRVLSTTSGNTVTQYKYNLETKMVSVFKKNKIEGK